MVKNTAIIKNFENKLYNIRGFKNRAKMLDSMYAYYLSVVGTPPAFKISDLKPVIRYARAINVSKIN